MALKFRGGGVQFVGVPNWAGPVGGLLHRWPLGDRNLYSDVVGVLNGAKAGAVASSAAMQNLTGAGAVTLPSCPVPSFTSAHSVSFWGMLATPTALGGGSVSQTFINFAIDASNGVRVLNNEAQSGGPSNTATELCVSLLKGGTNVGVETINNSATIRPNLRFHCAYTWDGSTLLLYVNGNLVSTSAQTNFAVNNGNAIGAQVSNFNGSITGAVGAVAVWGRALSATEVRSAYDADIVAIGGRHSAKLIAAGASNTQANSYADYSVEKFWVAPTDVNAGHGSTQTSDFNANFTAWVGSFYDANKTLNILTYQSTNGLDTFGLTPAQEYANVVTFVNSWRALGSNTRFVIMAQWGWTRLQTQQNLDDHVTLNNLFKSGVGGGTFDAYVDTFTISGLDTGISPLSATYSSDNQHLLAAGQALVVPRYVETVNSVWT